MILCHQPDQPDQPDQLASIICPECALIELRHGDSVMISLQPTSFVPE